MHILITGATGFIGSNLVKSLTERGDKVIALTRRKPRCKKNNNINYIEKLSEISGATKIDVIVNLAGAPISKGWNKLYKQKLIKSRIKTTGDLVEFIEKRKNKPSVLISASAVGYYGSWDGEVLDEMSKPKKEFTNTLCKKWEGVANKAKKSGVRVCITRLGVVLGKNGGALAQMLPAFKMGLGGKLGRGKQYFSWVHIDDVINCFLFLIDKKSNKGVFNLTAPHPVKNEVFTKNLGKILKRPTIFSMPSIVVKTLFGEMGETLLLKGQRVLPRKLMAAGFEFKYSKISEALNSIIN